jgi:REP-associated tyrosine transposase
MPYELYPFPFQSVRITQRYRTRYFTDSGIIGTKEFVSANYGRFKHLFMSKKDKIPTPVKGLDGVFSLKRLADS